MMVETVQPAALTIVGIFLALSTIFIVLRICARVIQYSNNKEWDNLIVWSDGLLLFAYILVVGQSYAIIQYTLYTWQGYHIIDIPKMTVNEIIQGQKFNLANQLLYNPVLSLVKASLICFLLRIGGTKPAIHIALWSTQALNVALAIAIFFAAAFQCTPFRYLYSWASMDPAAQKAAGADAKGMLDGKLIKGGTCFNQINFFLISAGLTVLTDVMVLVIPTIIVWKLQMVRRKKVIAAGILSVGVIVTGVSVSRLVIYYWRFSPKNKDRPYGVGYTVTSVEANLAIVTGCVPSLGPLMRRIAPKYFGSTVETSGSRPVPSGYLQQSGGSQDQYAMKSFGSNVEKEIGGWKGTGTTQAWSSDDNILPTELRDEIRKNVKVDVTFADVGDETASHDGRGADKRSF